MRGKKRVGGCLAGCAVVIVGVVVLAVFYWEKIDETFLEAKQTFGDLVALSETLQEEYGAPTNVGMTMGNQGCAVEIKIKDSILLEGVVPKQKAREIASFAKSRSDKAASCERVVVVFEKTEGTGILNVGETFTFVTHELSDLPPHHVEQ